MKNYKEIIGDGKLPNKYFVSISNDYMYLHDVNMLDWIGDLIPSFKSKSKTFETPFMTYERAKQFADSFALGEKAGGTDFHVNRVNIEDRLSGELYERTILFNPETGTSEDWQYKDVKYTANKMDEQGKKFE
jgi:hypothetical protein